MTSTIDSIVKEVEKFNDSIKIALNTKRISDTGEAARSLFVDHGSDFVRSIGIFYIEFLDTGRAPGKFPPKKPIEDWVKSKLGKSEADSDFDGIVFVIQRKIAKLGTAIFRNNNKGIELDKKIVTLRKAINNSVVESSVTEIKQRLNKFKIASIKNKYQI